MSDICQGQEYEILKNEVNKKVEELQVSRRITICTNIF